MSRSFVNHADTIIVQHLTQGTSNQYGLLPMQSEAQTHRSAIQKSMSDQPDMQQKRLKKIKRRKKITSLLYINSPKQNPYFVNPNSVLDSIQNFFHGDDLPYNDRILCMKLFGYGGMGKTQIAKAYIYQQGSMYQKIGWIDAEHGIINGFRLFLSKFLGKPIEETFLINRQVINDFYRRINYHSWLLVFDNVKNISELQDYLPSKTTRSGHMIITTQDPSSVSFDICIAKEEEIYGFQREKAIQYICQTLFTKKNKTACKMKDIQIKNHERCNLEKINANNLADRLGDHPLAITQALHTIYQRQTIPEYLDSFRFESENLKSDDIFDAYGKTIYVTQKLLSNRIPSGKSKKIALRIMKYFSVINANDIQLTLIRKLIGNEKFLEEAINNLLDLKLIEIYNYSNSEKSYTIHRSVQKMTWLTLGIKEKIDIVGILLNLFDKLVVYTGSVESFLMTIPYLQHAISMMTLCSEMFDQLNKESLTNSFRISYLVAAILSRTDKFSMADRFFQYADNLLDKISCMMTVDLYCDYLSELGLFSLYSGVNRESTYDKLVAQYEKFSGKICTKYQYKLTFTLGNLYRGKGEYESAKNIFKHLLSLEFDDGLIDKHLVVLINLAVISARHDHNFNESKQYFDRAGELLNQFKDGHSDMSLFYTTRGEVYFDYKFFDEAAVDFNNTLNLKRKYPKLAFIQNLIYVLRAHKGLARIYEINKQLEKAKNHINRAYQLKDELGLVYSESLLDIQKLAIGGLDELENNINEGLKRVYSTTKQKIMKDRKPTPRMKLDLAAIHQHGLPYCLNYFTEDGKYVNRRSHQLSDINYHLEQYKLMIFEGRPGIGKTTLSLAYCFTYGATEYPGEVFWFSPSYSNPASSYDGYNETNDKDFLRCVLGDKAFIPDDKNHRIRLFQEKVKKIQKALFIFDGIRDINTIKSYLIALQGNGKEAHHIIITNSFDKITGELLDKVYHIEPFGRDDTRRFFVQHGIDGLSDEKIDYLNGKFGYLPIALKALCSIYNDLNSIEDLIAKMKSGAVSSDKIRETILSKKDKMDIHSKSLNEILSGYFSQLDPLVIRLFYKCTYLSKNSIPGRLIIALAGVNEETAELVKNSFFTELNNDGTYSFPLLYWKFVKSRYKLRLNSSSTNLDTVYDVLSVFSNIFIDDQLQCIPLTLYEKYLPHVSSALKGIIKVFKDRNVQLEDNIKVINLIYNVSDIFYRKSESKVALYWIDISIKIANEVGLAKKHLVEWSRLYRMKAAILIRLKNMTEAEVIYRKILKNKRIKSSKKRRQLECAVLKSSLACLLLKKEHPTWDVSKKLLDESLGKKKYLRKAKDPEYAFTLRVLGEWYYMRGEFKEALEKFNIALGILKNYYLESTWRKTYKLEIEAHPSMQIIRRRIASSQRLLQDYDSALKTIDLIKTHRPPGYSDNHQHVLYVDLELAKIFFESSQYLESKKILLKILKQDKTIIDAVHYLGRILLIEGLYCEARVCFLKAAYFYLASYQNLEINLDLTFDKIDIPSNELPTLNDYYSIYIRIFHSDFAKILHYIGVSYYKEGCYSRAKIFYSEVSHIIEPMRLTEHPRVLTLYYHLAALEYREGNYSEARKRAEIILTKLKNHGELRRVEEKNTEIADTIRLLARINTQQNKIRGALDYFNEAISIYERNSRKMPNYYFALHGKAYLKIYSGYFQEAEILVETALKGLISIYKDIAKPLQLADSIYYICHPDIARIITAKGYLRYTQGYYLEAKQLLLNAHEIYSTFDYSTHSDFAQTQQYLGDVFYICKDFALAKKYLNSAIVNYSFAHPRSAIMYTTLAMIESQSENRDGAKMAFEKTQSCIDSLEKSSSDSRVVDYSKLEFNLSKGSHYFYFGDYMKAINCFSEAKKLLEKFITITDPKLIYLYANMNFAIMKLGNFKDAYKSLINFLANWYSTHFLDGSTQNITQNQMLDNFLGKINTLIEEHQQTIPSLSTIFHVLGEVLYYRRRSRQDVEMSAKIFQLESKLLFFSYGDMKLVKSYQIRNQIWGTYIAAVLGEFKEPKDEQVFIKIFLDIRNNKLLYTSYDKTEFYYWYGVYSFKKYQVMNKNKYFEKSMYMLLAAIAEQKEHLRTYFDSQIYLCNLELITYHVASVRSLICYFIQNKTPNSAFLTRWIAALDEQEKKMFKELLPDTDSITALLFLEIIEKLMESIFEKFNNYMKDISTQEGKKTISLVQNRYRQRMLLFYDDLAAAYYSIREKKKSYDFLLKVKATEKIILNEKINVLAIDPDFQAYNNLGHSYFSLCRTGTEIAVKNDQVASFYLYSSILRYSNTMMEFYGMGRYYVSNGESYRKKIKELEMIKLIRKSVGIIGKEHHSLERIFKSNGFRVLTHKNEDIFSESLKKCCLFIITEGGDQFNKKVKNWLLLLADSSKYFSCFFLDPARKFNTVLPNMKANPDRFTFFGTVEDIELNVLKCLERKDRSVASCKIQNLI